MVPVTVLFFNNNYTGREIVITVPCIMLCTMNFLKLYLVVFLLDLRCHTQGERGTCKKYGLTALNSMATKI